MPRLDKMKLAPNGLTVRLQRLLVDDEYLRVWRLTTDDAPADRHYVLVHGLGVSSEYFEPIAARLARTGAVHLLDLPGFDGVPHHGRRLGIGGYADVVAAWVRREGLVDPVLVGHSMGAQVVVEALARYPKLATRAVLVGPPVNASERSPVRQALRLAQSSLHESFGTRRTAVAGYLRCGPHWILAVLPGLLEYPIEDRVALVEARTLVVRGTWDRVAPHEWATLLADTLPAGSLAEITGASHSVVYEHFAELTELVIAHADGSELDGTLVDGRDPIASPDGLAVGTEEDAEDDAARVAEAIDPAETAR